MLIVLAAALALFVLPPLLGLAAVCVAVAVELAEVAVWRRVLSRHRIRTGAEGLVGQTGEVSQALRPEGRVRVRGESWRARGPGAIELGARVRVTAVDGLVLEVEPEP
jgi:membrane-bound serine protease (ClpP class)